ncbi:MAG: outer membrane protein assembly factor BamB [Burkholderiales bacterium]
MSRVAARGLVLVSGVLVVSACSWFGGGDKKMSPLTEYAPTATVATAWQKSIGRRSPIGFAPLLRDAVIYGASANGQVVATQLPAGQELWRVTLKEALSAGVGSGPSGVYVGTRKGEVVALDLSGKERWRSAVSSEILVAPQASGGVVVVRTVDGRIVGLNETDGKRRWLQQRTNPPLILRNVGQVAASDGLIYAGMPGGRLMATKVDDGALAWETFVSQPRGSTELERIADVVGAPIVDGERVCAVSYQGRLACFNAAKGNLDWYREVSGAAGVAKDQRALYTTDTRGHVLAFLKAGGTILWKQEKLQGRKLSGPAVFGNYVVVGDVEGYVHLLARDSGELAARVATDKSPIHAAPVITQQGVLVQTDKGNLYAISIH